MFVVLRMFHKRESNPITGLDRPSGYQEVDKTIKVVGPLGKYSFFIFIFYYLY